MPLLIYLFIPLYHDFILFFIPLYIYISLYPYSPVYHDIPFFLLKSWHGFHLPGSRRDHQALCWESPDFPPWPTHWANHVGEPIFGTNPDIIGDKWYRIIIKLSLYFVGQILNTPECPLISPIDGCSVDLHTIHFHPKSKEPNFGYFISLISIIKSSYSQSLVINLRTIPFSTNKLWLNQRTPEFFLNSNHSSPKSIIFLDDITKISIFFTLNHSKSNFFL